MPRERYADGYEAGYAQSTYRVDRKVRDATDTVLERSRSGWESYTEFLRTAHLELLGRELLEDEELRVTFSQRHPEVFRELVRLDPQVGEGLRVAEVTLDENDEAF